MTRLLQAGWDRLSMYLPLALMGLVALGTYWLVQSTPVPKLQVIAGPARHEPDYFMKNFSVKTFIDTGRLKSEVFGVAARHFPDTDMLEIDAVRIRAFDQQGRLTTATATRALTNGDGSEVELFGQALVVREEQAVSGGRPAPRMEFRGEYLHAFVDNEKLVSNRPVELRRGLDVFVADSMDFDNVQQVMVMRGRVKGVLAPPRAK